MKFFYRTKGVISIFLIIVMLPLFTSAVLLVDGARFQSAKTLIQEAGDLAAYSTIANYNIELKDQYGLFAIDDNDVQATFESYFRDSLGYSATDSEDYSKIVQNAISTGIFKLGKYKDANFFNMYNFIVDNASAEPLYPLSTPAVLQNQIVEYAKYRGVETVLERFEVLNSFQKLSEEQAKNEKVAAKMEDMSELDSCWGHIASNIDTLVKNVESYRSKLSSYAGVSDTDMKTEKASGYAKSYENSCMNYYVVLACKSSGSRTGSGYKNSLKTIGDELQALYDTIYNSCSNIQSSAESALVDYRKKLDYYGDDPDLCDDIRETISILEKVTSTSESDKEYSVVALKKAISSPADLITETNDNISKLDASIDNAVNEYNRAKQAIKNKDLPEEEEQAELDKLSYHIFLKDGKEWAKTKDGSYVNKPSDDALTTSAIYAVETFDLKNNLVRDARLYDMPKFKNYYLAKAKETPVSSTLEKNVGDPKDLSKNTVNDANNKKNEEDDDTNKNDGKTRPENVTIDGDDWAELPSQKAKSGAGDTGSKKQISNIGETDAKNMIKDSSQSGSFLTDLLESGRNDILTYCYLFDMFKTRVTGENITIKDKPVGIADKYLVDWRYTESGEKDMRDRIKNSDECKSYFGTSEVEYVFAGSSSEMANETIVYSWIYGTRLVNNLVAVYIDKNANDQCDMLAALSSVACGGTVPPSVFKWIYIAAWAVYETAVELDMLIDHGYRVPLFKGNGMLVVENFWDAGKSADNLLRTKKNNTSILNSITVSYEDYLIIMLCFVGRETRLLRIADLIQLNMGKRTSQELMMNDAFTYIKADTSVSMKYMFQPIQQFSNSYDGTGLKINNVIYQGY